MNDEALRILLVEDHPRYREALADALRRNVLPDAPAWPQAQDLAAYLLDCHARLATQSDADLLQGRMTVAVGDNHDSPT